MSKNENGFAQVFLVLLLSVALGISVFLVQQKTHILPFAHEDNPNSVNSLTQQINELDSMQQIDNSQIVGNKTVTIPISVFDDLNRNSMRDNGETGIPNIAVKAFIRIDVTDAETREIKHLVGVRSGLTDKDGKYSLSFLRAVTLSSGEKTELKSLLITLGNKESHGVLIPIGWEKTNMNSPYIVSVSNFGDPLEDIVTEPVQFPLIGQQKISGTVFYDANKNGVKDVDEGPQAGIGILIDASKSDNTSKKVYYSASMEDGHFEFINLPPLTNL